MHYKIRFVRFTMDKIIFIPYVYSIKIFIYLLYTPMWSPSVSTQVNFTFTNYLLFFIVLPRENVLLNNLLCKFTCFNIKHGNMSCVYCTDCFFFLTWYLRTLCQLTYTDSAHSFFSTVFTVREFIVYL
jgi:hypothetical protein